jgi:hypothetical protein
MLGEFNQDIMGTSPKYPPVSNLDYLTVDTNTYDNYPSDNNPVRIQCKLNELWNPKKKDCGINLVPNLKVKSLGLRNSGEDKNEVVANFCRETKKAMMKGFTGKRLAGYLRSRFDKETIKASKDEMEKLSKEQGLIGNVYIDASAFSSPHEAEQFLSVHRNRLAQDILINDGVVNHNVIAFLANKFHKNVVANIIYDQDLFDKYKVHLVHMGKIDDDYIIDSKESLRLAFLAEPVKEEVKVTKSGENKTITEKEAVQVLSKYKEEEETLHRFAAEEITFRKIRPIVEFTRFHFSRGKSGNDLKEMLRSKYASVDLKEAAKYLPLVISPNVGPESIDKLVEGNKISEKIGEIIKGIIKKNALHVQSFEESKPDRQIGVPGHIYVMTTGNTVNTSEYHQASVKALKEGKDINQIKDDLLQKLSEEEADKVLIGAVKAFNEVPAGVVANPVIKTPKKKLVADLKEPETLPNPETVVPQTQEYINFFKGADLTIDVGENNSNTKLLDISGLDSKSGIDNAL